MDRDEVSRADVLIATSEKLQARLAEQGRASVSFPHEGDIERRVGAGPRADRSRSFAFCSALVVSI